MLSGCLGGSPVLVPHLASALVAWLHLRRLGGQPQQSTWSRHLIHRIRGHLRTSQNSALQPSYRLCHKSVGLARRSEEFSCRG